MFTNRSISRRSALKSKSSLSKLSSSRVLFEACEQRRMFSSVSGTVFNDLNGDGARGSNDTGLQGVTVFTDFNNNGVVDTDFTADTALSDSTDLPDGATRNSAITVAGRTGRVKDINVHINLDHLRASDLVATLVSPTGATVTLFNRPGLGTGSESNGFNGSITFDSQAAFALGGSLISGTFRPTQSLSTMNGENPNGTWTLRITDARTGQSGLLHNWSMTMRTGEFSDVTSSTGAYSISAPGLSGTTRVRMLRPSNSVNTTTNPLLVSVLDRTTAVSGQDFGLAFLGSVSGNVFHDINGDTIHVSSDPNLPGITMFVDTNRDGIMGSDELIRTVTDANGNYTISGLRPGSFRIMPNLVGTGFIPINPSSGFRDVNILSGSTLGARNYGLAQPVSIRGTVFEDSNANGAVSSGETGLSGVTVFLDTNNNGVLDSGELSTTSAFDNPFTIKNETGSYSFGTNLGLRPGTYHVRAVRPSGFLTQPTTTATGQFDLSLTSGQSATANFGFVKPGTISGTIFHDRNGNGVRDIGEEGIFGRTVFIDFNGNGTPDPGELRVTNADGNYTFTNVRPGSVVVQEQVLAGTTVPVSARTVSLFSGQTVTGVNFAEIF